MTKHALRYTVLIFLSVCVFISCKKTHPLNPYPENVRLLSFTKSSTTPGSTSGLNETYRFVYDGYNRVVQITHTKNDGSSNLVTTLNYRNDTIYDTTRYMNLSTIVEIDSFITDKKGLISVTYEPGVTTTYEYSGKLLTRKSFSSSNYFFYTSYNSNFIKSTSSVDPADNVQYTYYTDKFNRTGDYLQLNSFLKYGFNFFQNDNLVWKVIRSTDTTKLQYVIDADNKITRTTANIVDTFGNQRTEVYDLQYEIYK